MAIAVSDVTIDGFDSHNTDVQAVFLAQPIERIQAFDTNILKPMVDAEMNPGSGRHVAVTIIAHSDRQDAPGLTQDARRADELQVSIDRANNAIRFLFEQFAEELRRLGGTVPTTDFDDAQNVSVITVAAGAGHLINPTPGNDENLRRQNRRFVLVAVTFPKF